MNMIRLTPEQNKQIDALLMKKFGSKVLVNKETADVIKARLTMTLEKAAEGNKALTKEDIQKAFQGLDAVRDSMTKTGGIRLKE
jgi:hypothetical protein